MTANFAKSFYRLVLILLLAACSVHLPPTANLAEMSREDFMTAMRWKRFQVAASLMRPELRQEFMANFAPLRDLHIVDVRLLDVQTFDDGVRFETALEMDYYLPPSVTVKTFAFTQGWEYFRGEGSHHQGFMIVTPFPAFP